jgi:predicted metal-binding membrane protein
MRHGGFRGDVRGCLRLGLSHGAYCVGCCWVLMALLLVGGVMNVLFALLALLAFLERVTSMGRVIARFAGIVLVVGGAWLFAMGTS